MSALEIQPLPAVIAHEARTEVIHRELNDIAERLRPVRDPQRLAFAIVAAVVGWCGARRIGGEWDRSIAEVALLLGLAKAAATVTADLSLWCERADRLAARFFRPVGRTGAFPWERRAPFELATMLRRACEADVARFLPLVVRDARALLVDLGGDPRIVEQLVAAAIREGDELNDHNPRRAPP